MEPNQQRSKQTHSNTPAEPTLEKVIQIDRINKVVKGGKRLSFRAFIIKGNLKGSVGFATGKSKEVPIAIRKGIEKAQKYQHKINIINDTIPHEISGKFGSSRVVLKPARPGTGVIAGSAMRAIFECAGIHDIVSKSLGTSNPYNMVWATFQALGKLNSPRSIADKRSKEISEIIKRRNAVLKTNNNNNNNEV